MPLKQPPPSETVRRALRDDVAGYMKITDPMAKTLVQAPLALRVFTLRLDKVEEPFKDSPQPAGWRFMALNSSGMPIAGDVVDRGNGSGYRMISLSRDPLIAEVVLAVRKVEALPEVQGKDYELRLLRVPGILAEAFWLKPVVGEDHLLTPILTKSKRLLEKSAYPVADFLNIVKELKAEFEEKSNAPGKDPHTSSV